VCRFAKYCEICPKIIVRLFYVYHTVRGLSRAVRRTVTLGGMADVDACLYGLEIDKKFDIYLNTSIKLQCM